MLLNNRHIFFSRLLWLLGEFLALCFSIISRLISLGGISSDVNFFPDVFYITVRSPGILYMKPWRRSCRAPWPSRGSKQIRTAVITNGWSVILKIPDMCVTCHLFVGLWSRWSFRSAWKTMIPRRTSVSPALSGSTFYCLTHPFPCASPALSDYHSGLFNGHVVH